MKKTEDIISPKTNYTDQVTFWHSLNSRGLVFVILLVVYGSGLVSYVLNEKKQLLVDFSTYEKLVQDEAVLMEAELAAFSAVTSLFLMVDSTDRAAVLEQTHQHFLVLQERYRKLAPFYPAHAESFKSLLAIIADGVMQPSVNKLLQLKTQLGVSNQELAALLVEVRKKRDQAIKAYRWRSNQVALHALLAGVLGLILMGGITMVFFHQMTGDIKTLGQRIQAIMRGGRDHALLVRRKDELGRVISGTNSLVEALENRKQELEIERSRSRYQEKTKTLSNLAAGLVHELGNPVAAIIGLCDSLDMNDVQSDTSLGNINYIKAYADRLKQLTDDLAVLAAPQNRRYGLVNVNDIMTVACGHIRFDERWHTIDLDLQLDTHLPAIYGYGDQLSLLFLHLISNAFDALTDVNGSDCRLAHKQIIIRTAGYKSGVEIVIEDTGHGMDKETMTRCFDHFFTTKDGLDATGLGLPLCQAVVNVHGGGITIDSHPDRGTQVTIKLPLGQPLLDEELAISNGDNREH